MLRKFMDTIFVFPFAIEEDRKTIRDKINAVFNSDDGEVMPPMFTSSLVRIGVAYLRRGAIVHRDAPSG